jgi:hypothetical protein
MDLCELLDIVPFAYCEWRREDRIGAIKNGKRTENRNDKFSNT